jgi:predicted alpha/beta-fold hydrolase
MNLRNCGGTEALARTLYNAGQSSDVGRVLERLDRSRFPRPFATIGFSLGGNLVLRYAAIEGVACRADAVAAVNPPIDLERCARALERPANRLYQAYYTRRLTRDLRRILAVREFSGLPPPDGSIRSVRRFDELYTAPDAGLPSAEEYYARASAGPRLGGLARPTLVISAANDPVVPVEMFEGYHGLKPARFLHPRRGGHCGYWQASRPRFWASDAILRFLDPM